MTVKYQVVKFRAAPCSFETVYIFVEILKRTKRCVKYILELLMHSFVTCGMRKRKMSALMMTAERVAEGMKVSQCARRPKTAITMAPIGEYRLEVRFAGDI